MGDSFTEHSSAYGALGVCQFVFSHIPHSYSLQGKEQHRAPASQVAASQRSVVHSDAEQSQAASQVSERQPQSKAASQPYSDTMWDEPALVWAAWDGAGWRKLTPDTLEEALGSGSFALPEQSSDEANIPAYTQFTQAQAFECGLKVYKSQTGDTVVRFRDAHNGEANLRYVFLKPPPPQFRTLSVTALIIFESQIPQPSLLYDWVCETCNRLLSNISAKKNHMKTHAKAKPGKRTYKKKKKNKKAPRLPPHR